VNGPRRLLQSGGVSRRLLDSASLDVPSDASRRKAASFAATAGAFARSSSSTASASTPRGSVAKTLVTWTLIGAAASGTLALVGTKVFNLGASSNLGHAASPAMAELPSAASIPPLRSPDIAAEPTVRASATSVDEARQIEAARAAVSRNDDASAIASLDAYDAAHPNGSLKPEAIVLRIQALGHSGKTVEAQALANEFQKKYPQHPLAQQLKRSFGQ
jgi:hypothetical protein